MKSTCFSLSIAKLPPRNGSGCMHLDVLQGTGFFPATFYSNIEGDLVDNTVVYNFGDQGPLAKWCAAETDNVANFIAFTVPKGEFEVYGSIPVKFGTSDSSSQTVSCLLVNEGFGDQYRCDTANFGEDSELELEIIFE